MLKISDGTDDFALLAIPFFVLAGGDHGRGRHGRAPDQPRQVFVGFIRGGLALVNILASTLFGCISGSSVADTASIGSVMIPQMVKAGYPRVFATNVTICGSVQALLIPPSHNAVIYSLAAGGTVSVAHLFLAGIFPGLLFGALPDRAGAVDRAQARTSRRASRSPLQRGAEDRRRRAVGPGHRRHHHGRHPVRRVHADRVGGGGLRLRVPGDVLRLPRLQVARAAAPRPPRREDGGDGDDADRLLGRLRLHDGDHADPGQGDAVLPRHLGEQVRLPAARQPPAAAAGHVHGPGADAADLHADLHAGDRSSSASTRCTSA